MSNKTQGPWFAVRPDHCGGWWVVSRDPEGFDSVDESRDGGFEEETARFIAAAPELLDFIKDWLGRQGTDENYMTAKAKSVIEKATGG